MLIVAAAAQQLTEPGWIGVKARDTASARSALARCGV